MATVNYVIQGVIGLLIVAPFVFFVFKRIRRIEELNQTAKSHFDIWKDLQKNKGDL